MPTYVYECQKCSKIFEVFQSMSEAPLKTCPKGFCKKHPWGKGKVKRIPSGGAGLIFKGSGFYITDYRSDAYKKAKESESSKSKSEKGTPKESKSKKKTTD
ncbi:MAG: FmdB family zinc ribbon protein [Verrucomicrobiota bacterium]